MERRGLVAREDCTTDRRGAFVVLTAAGREAIENGGAGARGHRPSVGLRRAVEGAVHHTRVIRQPRPVAAGRGGGGSPARRADTVDVLIVSAQVPTALACVDHMQSVIPGLRWTTA